MKNEQGKWKMKKAFAIIMACAVLALAAVWPLGRMSLGGRKPCLTSEEDFRANDRPPGNTSIQGTGYVEPVTELRRLVFQIDGVIGRCAAEVGGTYKRGEILMELDSREQRAMLAIAEAELALARADQAKVLSGTNPHLIDAAAQRIDVLKEQDRYWANEHNRYAALVSRSAVTQSEYDKTASEMHQHRSALRQAEADLRHLRDAVRDEDRCLTEAKVAASKARLELARHRLAQTTLLAPCDGKVLELFRREGEGARVIDAEPVAIFADTAQLRVRGEIDERFVSSLRVGQRAVISGRGLGDSRHDGRVGKIKPMMGKKTVFSRAATERKDLDVVEVVVELDDAFRAPIGLEVDIAIVTDERSR